MPSTASAIQRLMDIRYMVGMGLLSVNDLQELLGLPPEYAQRAFERMKGQLFEDLDKEEEEEEEEEQAMEETTIEELRAELEAMAQEVARARAAERIALADARRCHDVLDPTNRELQGLRQQLADNDFAIKGLHEHVARADRVLAIASESFQRDGLGKAAAQLSAMSERLRDMATVLQLASIDTPSETSSHTSEPSAVPPHD